MRRLRQTIRYSGIDVVEAHASWDHWLSAVALRGLPGGPPLVRFRHHRKPIVRHAPNRWLYATATDRFLTQTRDVRSDILATGFVADESVSVLGSSVDLDRFKPDPAARSRVRSELGIPASAKVLGYVGRLSERKRPGRLVETYREVAGKRPDTWLVVVGWGERRHAAILEDAARDDERVVFVGRRNDPEAFYPAFDAFVLPSYAESFPRAAIEAMACGVVTVTGSDSGLRDFVDDGVSGRVLADDSASSFAAATLDLWARPSAAAAWRRAALVSSVSGSRSTPTSIASSSRCSTSHSATADPHAGSPYRSRAPFRGAQSTTRTEAPPDPQAASTAFRRRIRFNHQGHQDTKRGARRPARGVRADCLGVLGVLGVLVVPFDAKELGGRRRARIRTGLRRPRPAIGSAPGSAGRRRRASRVGRTRESGTSRESSGEGAAGVAGVVSRVVRVAAALGIEPRVHGTAAGTQAEVERPRADGRRGGLRRNPGGPSTFPVTRGSATKRWKRPMRRQSRPSRSSAAIRFRWNTLFSIRARPPLKSQIPGPDAHRGRGSRSRRARCSR